MAGIIPISNPFPSTLSPPLLPNPNPHRSLLPFPPHAASDSDDITSSDQDSGAAANSDGDATFENRLAQVRLKYRSGTGKKAEQRRSKKSPSSSSGKNKKAVMLPPVPLRSAMSAMGVEVEIGFTPYSERLNGRLAGLGLAALLLVELASGKPLVAYHAPAVIFIQIYTVAAAAAVFVKFEKERISVWPQKPVAAAVEGGGD
ncbi:uncharacterized protein [Typha latifolia]|uniref:uncharacterized protein n=1 Tax=Typha latifolia TaxID=4733 RepID=UPI003C307EA7